MSTVEMSSAICRCGQTFTYEKKRSRPPVWCESCRESINASERSRIRRDEHNALPPEERTTMSPKDRVDYLELLLRSRGTHISQHRKD